MDPQLPIQNCFKKWVHDSTRGVEGYLMNFHGPTITYLKFFKTLVHDSTRGVEGYLLNFHGPRKYITFQKLVYCNGPKTHVESWHPNLMYLSGPFESTILHECGKNSCRIMDQLVLFFPWVHDSTLGPSN